MFFVGFSASFLMWHVNASALIRIFHELLCRFLPCMIFDGTAWFKSSLKISMNRYGKWYIRISIYGRGENSPLVDCKANAIYSMNSYDCDLWLHQPPCIDLRYHSFAISPSIPWNAGNISFNDLDNKTKFFPDFFFWTASFVEVPIIRSDR